MSLFLSCARMGFKSAMNGLVPICVSVATYAVIVVTYAGVLKAIDPSVLARYGLTNAQMLWYLGTTELFAFCCATGAYREVQGEFLSETAHMAILRPLPHIFVRLFIWFGDSLAWLAIFFPTYVVLLTFLSGGHVPPLTALAGVLASAPVSFALGAIMAYAVGASCLWFVQSEPAFWIVQKLIFLLGAMLWPVSFYPDWLAALVYVMPFFGMMAQAGSFMLDLPATSYALGFLNQAVWLVLFLWGARAFDRRVIRTIQSGEG